jgi:hypothetical protein
VVVVVKVVVVVVVVVVVEAAGARLMAQPVGPGTVLLGGGVRTKVRIYCY